MNSKLAAIMSVNASIISASVDIVAVRGVEYRPRFSLLHKEKEREKLETSHTFFEMLSLLSDSAFVSDLAAGKGNDITRLSRANQCFGSPPLLLARSSALVLPVAIIDVSLCLFVCLFIVAIVTHQLHYSAALNPDCTCARSR